MEDLVTLWNLIGELKAGNVGAGALVATGVVRILRLSFIQNTLPPALKWKNWQGWVQKLVVSVLALVAATAAGVVTGSGVGAAVLAAVPVAFGLHKTTQLAGRVLPERVLETSAGQLAFGQASRKLSLRAEIPSPSEIEDLRGKL